VKSKCETVWLGVSRRNCDVLQGPIALKLVFGAGRSAERRTSGRESFDQTVRRRRESSPRGFDEKRGNRVKRSRGKTPEWGGRRTRPVPADRSGSKNFHDYLNLTRTEVEGPPTRSAHSLAFRGEARISFAERRAVARRGVSGAAGGQNKIPAVLVGKNKQRKRCLVGSTDDQPGKGLARVTVYLPISISRTQATKMGN